MGPGGWRKISLVVELSRQSCYEINEGKTTDEKQPCALVCVLHAVFPYADDGYRDGIVRHGTECELINYDTSRNTVS